MSLFRYRLAAPTKHPPSSHSHGFFWGNERGIAPLPHFHPQAALNRLSERRSRQFLDSSKAAPPRIFSRWSRIQSIERLGTSMSKSLTRTATPLLTGSSRLHSWFARGSAHSSPTVLLFPSPRLQVIAHDNRCAVAQVHEPVSPVVPCVPVQLSE